MAKEPKKPGHSDDIESLAGKTLQDPNAGKVAKKLAAAVLAHADGEPKKPAAPKPAPKPKPKPAPKPKPKATPKK
ncbi:hypothetical protein D3C86_1099540 [compost metagenome]